MSKKITVPPKEELVRLYQEEGCTISSLARLYNTSNPTVRTWLIKYDIERKTQKQASTEANNTHRKTIKPSKDTLSKLYEVNSQISLCKIFNVAPATMNDWLKEYDIKRTHSESCSLGKERQFQDIRFTKEFLDAEYDRSQPIEALANKLGVSRSYIRKELLANDIEIKKLDPSWRSKAETDLYDFLVSMFPYDEWQNNDKSIINPYELDIVNKTKKIAIEYCGLYWHSESSSNKTPNYHTEKLKMCREKGFKLITVFESDDMIKVKSLLLKLLGNTNKIGARKTVVRKINSKDANKFHNEHHIHSAVGGSYHCGLFFNEELVMVASFSKTRFNKKYEYECARMTSHSNFTIVGGASKLFDFFIRESKPSSIITYSDLRFGEGNVYTHCGFKRLKDSDPNYWYHKKSLTLFSRIRFQKHKLKTLLEVFDEKMTEFENMKMNGWDRIWDCGNAVYVWENKKGGSEDPPQVRLG